MDYLPIFITARDQRILVVGEGQLAEAKCRAVLKSTAQVTLVSEAPTETMLSWADQGLLVLHQRPCCREDLSGVRLAYAASESTAVNDEVANWARQMGVWINVLDRPEACDFITPAIVDRDPVVVAIGTEGTAPVLARQIKADIEALLPSQLGRLAKAASTFRGRVSDLLAPGRPRRAFWAEFFNRTTVDTGCSDGALEDSLAALLTQHARLAQPEGRVAFVGAGPGDPELLTVRARRLIHEADVLVYDRLVSSEVLDLARKEAKFICVGKKGFGPSVSQQEINAHLLREASRGLFVVRLKGGDPGIFGRLDEELESVSEVGIATEVVPGVTAASAAAAALQVSLTRRNRNSSVSFLTAHDARGFAEHDWQQLVRSRQTLAIYMGRKTATFLQGRLLMHGADRELPVTCIENISLPQQRAFVSDLGHFVKGLDDEGFNGPLMILIGITGPAAMRAGQSAARALAQEPVLDEVAHGSA